MEVRKAAKEKPAPSDVERVTLLPASVTTAPEQEAEDAATPAAAKQQEDADVSAVFAKLKQIGGGRARDEDDE
jgi:hypothetical protein